MSGIKLLLILVIAVLIVVLFKYVQIKRQIRNLSKQMTDLTTGKTEKMLDISLVDKDIEQLAAVLNQYNEKQRQSIASVIACRKLDAANHCITLELPWLFLLALIAVLAVIYLIFTAYAKAELKKAEILPAIREE